MIDEPPVDVPCDHENEMVFKVLKVITSVKLTGASGYVMIAPPTPETEYEEAP
jgi:hypothetical protein